MAWDSDCTSCYWLTDKKGEKRDCEGKFFCDACREYVSANQRISDCPVYRQSNCDSNRSTFEKDRMRRYSREHGYYLVTAISEILGLSNDNIYMNVFKALSDNIMRLDDSYDSFIDEYDEYGPIYADKLKKDKDSLELAFSYAKNNLNDMCYYYNNKDYYSAIETYINLYEEIKERYSLEIEGQKGYKR